MPIYRQWTTFHITHFPFMSNLTTCHFIIILPTIQWFHQKEHKKQPRKPWEKQIIKDSNKNYPFYMRSNKIELHMHSLHGILYNTINECSGQSLALVNMEEVSFTSLKDKPF